MDSIAPGPTLFRQIAVRLAAFTVLFAVLDVGIVVATYSSQPESLAEELLTLEAQRYESASEASPDPLAGPPGARNWSARVVESNPSGATDPREAATLMDWTRREKIADGYRITGVRSVDRDGGRRWLLMRFDAAGIEPYVPVIVNEIVQHVALPLVPLSLFLLIFNIVAVRRVLDPLSRAEHEVDRLDPDNMLLRLSEPAAPREVGTLVRAVNRALDRLDESIQTLRTFTANAAHELRTPLAIMQLSLEGLPPSKQRDGLQDDTSHMSRLVGQMLDLAQADALASRPDNVVDLGDVGREVVANLAPIAFEADRELRFEDRGDAAVRGHAEAIHRIYRNLIENALAHAPGSSPIEIVAGPGPQLTVRDFGPGIAADDLPHIFERFWRRDRSRSDGAGLGLGIVKRLAEAHGGGIRAMNPLGGGALFQVWFDGDPLPPPPGTSRHGATPASGSRQPPAI